MKKLWLNRGASGYAAVVLGCFLLAYGLGLLFANQVDSAAYDAMFRLYPPFSGTTHSMVLSIDDATFNAMGGQRSLRGILATALDRIADAGPQLVAVDLILSDPGDPAEDARLDRAFRRTPKLILATDWANGSWEMPLPQFKRSSVAIGQTLADVLSTDGVTRQIFLEQSEGHKGYRALSLEAFRVASGALRIEESPRALQVGSRVIPARESEHRPLRIRYLRNGIPQIAVKSLLEQPALAERFRGKAVFVGVYSNTAARDRVFTPYGERISGVAVNAQAFETMARGDFLIDASNGSVLLFCIAVAVAAGLIFRLLSGWPAYLAGAALLGLAHTLPFILFQYRIIFPYLAPLSCAWLTVAGAAIYQHFVVRRELHRSENERTRYRQAIHFVTHEMRTPLTAIQGSSELIGRYNLNEDKRKQIAGMINSESKRLARMIQTFLDVERLSDGQVELKREPFDITGLVDPCLDRARPLAERKRIQFEVEQPLEGAVSGDRELLEYAVYNLLTNAVKYSPPGTKVTVSSHPNGAELRLSVQDQGIGIDPKELKRIFQKFYRTRRAEASGESGSGIGLSIVEQIVVHHGGRMEVSSVLGEGSRFTVVLPAFSRDRKLSPVSN